MRSATIPGVAPPQSYLDLRLVGNPFHKRCLQLADVFLSQVYLWSILKVELRVTKRLAQPAQKQSWEFFQPCQIQPIMQCGDIY